MNIITNDKQQCTIAAGVLRQVIDPEIGLNVIDLGLIRQVDFDEQQLQIFVSLTLTTQFCPMGEFILTAISNALTSCFSGYLVNISLSFDPPWNAGMISEAGQLILNR